MPRKYYIITNLKTKEETYVNTLEDIERITGIQASTFRAMTDRKSVV